ncbi:MAG TPA: DNA polymerase III subunit delta [Symbiobacteriaceae bacterium]|nr:DNA polymerase III subunit delta [Symbiobacteriaceae bacterium]
MNQSEALAELQKGKVRPVYLLYGGEPFLEEALFREIKQATVDEATADFNFHVMGPASDQIPQALAVAQTQPFFAERRLVVVKDCPVFSASRKKADESEDGEEEGKGNAGEESLIAYLKSPVASTCLVFICDDNVDSRKKVTKALIGTGGAVECKPYKPDEAIHWAEARATSVYGKKLNDAAARLLVEKVGADLRLIDNELQKVVLYVGDAKMITVPDVDKLVGGMAETEIFRLTEAVMLKDRARAIELLARILRQVDHPLQVLAALTNRFRQILTVKTLVARGVSLREGPGIAKMHPFAYEKMVGHVRSYSREEILRAMNRLLEADVAMKSGFDAKLAVETLVVELMQ